MSATEVGVIKPVKQSAIKKVVEEFLKYFSDYKAGGELNLHRLVGDIGGRIEYDNDAFEDSITVEDNRKFLIKLNPASSILRERFAIAHELAHFILHSNFGEKQAKWGEQVVPSGWNGKLIGLLLRC